MAPGANILFVGAPSNYRDLDAALNHVVDQHLANIVTNSYGFTDVPYPGAGASNQYSFRPAPGISAVAQVSYIPGR